ncbi:MAG: cation diffusion facilitator family transporter [Candidatus Omnitrophica bacterium]|nr:cation diffusion facilitator family transporter [Candidatus Omnitrophota bacterium]MBU1808546.1 cation diffusion facilitator family transporter [Candidatus Omnitrophota bacterium]
MSDYIRIRRVLIIILVLNWAVAAAKMVVGLLTRVQSMTADGFHSLSDGTSNIIGLIGIGLSARPIDQDHPYGHKKYETFFSLGIAALLMLIAFNLIRDSFSRFFNPVTPHVEPISFIVMLVTIAVNILVVKYEYKQGKKLRSDLLVADSMHTKADVYTSLSVIVALIGIKMGFPIVDPIATFIISLFIGYAAYKIIKDASRILCDTVAIIDSKKISMVVMGIKGVKACHKIRTRGRPDDICIDLHVQVDAIMSVDEGHNVSYAVEAALKMNIPEVTDVLVHLEPKYKQKK